MALAEQFRGLADGLVVAQVALVSDWGGADPGWIRVPDGSLPGTRRTAAYRVRRDGSRRGSAVSAGGWQLGL